jgi:hypothetical protein
LVAKKQPKKPKKIRNHNQGSLETPLCSELVQEFKKRLPQYSTVFYNHKKFCVLQEHKKVGESTWGLLSYGKIRLS